MIEGIILKGIGGFYYVDTAEGLIECKARGRFRKTVGKPIVGDRVTLEIQPEDGTGYLQTIAPRKNSLIRPAVANLDLVVAVASAAPPVTDPFLIDKVTAIVVHKNMDALVVINKTDANPGDELYETYRRSGIEVLRVSAHTGEGIDALRERIRGRVSAFAGNSGVGKSSVLNRLDSSFGAEVGAISDKIGRGKHTTRHVEMFPLDEDTYVIDTPGFSSFDTEEFGSGAEGPPAGDLPEFAPYLGQCRFVGCSHVKEKGCAVLQAVKDGRIPASRHRSYVRLYDELKDLRDWQHK